MSHEYESLRRVCYDDATFVSVCEACGRFVKADKNVYLDGLGELIDKPNATCKKCGRTKMLFEGFM